MIIDVSNKRQRKPKKHRQYPAQKNEQYGPTKNKSWTHVLTKGKQFLFLYKTSTVLLFFFTDNLYFRFNNL